MPLQTHGKGLTKAVQTERGFITRCFYERNGQTMVQTYSEALAIGVRADWFTDASSRVIWKAASDLFSDGNLSSATLVNLINASLSVIKSTKDKEERGVIIDLSFFSECQSYVSANDDVTAYAKLLLDAYIARKTSEAYTDAMERMNAGCGAASALSMFIGQAQNILQLSNSRKELSLSDLGDQVVKEYETAYHEIVEKGNYEYTPGIKMPWRKLSYALNGFDSDVYIIAARPGVGKTSFALNFSRFWIDSGYKVVFNSVDMSPKGFVKRVLSEKTRISSRQMQFAKSYDFKADIEKIKGELNWLKELEKSGNFKALKEYDIDALKADVAILKDQGQIDVLIVDYLQLMSCRDAARIGSTAKATYISNTLHAMAVELNLPILCLSQLNRENTKDGGREPQLSDLRDSGAIEQDAAAVMLLFRDETLQAKWKDAEPPVQFAKNMTPSLALNSYCPVWCLIAKSREGDVGTRIPFVVIQNKYAWYQADYEKKGAECFKRVYDDWRHDDIEKVWEANGSLIKMADVRALEIKNINLRRAEKGLPPLPSVQEPTVGFSAPEKVSEPQSESPLAHSSPQFDPYDLPPYEGEF